MGRRGICSPLGSCVSESIVGFSALAVACVVVVACSFAGGRLGAGVRGADCNANGIEDAEEMAPEIRFPGPARYPAGGFPAWIVSSDFDGDGRLDLATANQEGGNVTILWNRGGRRFVLSEGIPAGSRPFLMEPADIEGDRDIDLLVPDPAGPAVVVLSNDGSGAVAASSTVRASGSMEAVHAGDVDGDALPDLVLVLKKGVEIVWAEGPGTFGETRTELRMQNPRDAQIADFDRNSRLDAALIGTDQVRIFFQGTARSFWNIEYPLSAAYSSLLVADLNGDGAPDLAGCHDPWLRVFLNDGRGGFSNEPTSETPFPAGARSLIALDLDSDGDLDLAASTSEGGSLSLALNDGSGYFGSLQHYALRSYRRPLAGDFDGDGRIDVAATYPWEDEVSILWGEGPGELDGSPLYFDSTGVAGPQVGGDVDGDGAPELILGAYDWVRVYRYIGGRMVASSSVAVPGGARRVATGDFDGDGKLDLAVLSGNSRVLVLFGRGDGRFGTPVEAWYPVAGWVLAAADVDENGRTDLVVAQDVESAYLVLGSLGDGRFALLSRDQRFGKSPALALGDIDRDGHVDMVFDAEGHLYALQGNGRGEFLSWQDQFFGANLEALDLADIDGDGDLDVVATERFQLILWLAGPLGKLGDPIHVPGGNNNLSQAIADLEGDGDLDAVVTSAGSDEGIVFVNEGRGAMRLSPHVLDVGSDPLHVAAMDANADGLPDFVFTGSNSSAFVTVLNRSVRGLTDGNGNGILDVCEVPFHRGDADGDGSLVLSDAQCVIGYALLGGAVPPCLNAADANGDLRVDLSDGIFVLNYLFRGGASPPSPGPPPQACGLEPAHEEGSRSAPGCERYDGC